MNVEDLPEMGSQSVGKVEVEHIMDAPGENFDEHDTFPVPKNSVSQPQHGQEDNSGVRDGENRWTGWPGDNVYRLLVPVHKVGGIIGRKGEFIKKMCEETGARIKILDGPQGTEERAVMVSAKEELDRSLPPAIDGLLRVHERIIDGLDGDSTHAPPGSTSSRLLMDASQAGNLIGKQGTTIKSIQEASNCIIRVLGSEALPVFSLQDDRVVEILGEPAAVHKALELAATHLRKFLVDRSVIVQFEKQMQNPSPHMEQNMPPHKSWGPPPQGFPQNAGGGSGFGPGPQYMMPPPPRHHDNYYPPADMPPMEKPPHQGLSMYGRDVTVGVNSSSNVLPPQTVMAQITQHMQIPLSYADAVIGNAGGHISYTRRASGATITIQETRGVPGEMTVEINGTASEVQAAQQLIQNFMAEAAAGSAQNQGSGPPDNSYPPHNSVYSSPPNPGHTGQSAVGYNSGYNNNYGGANSYGGANNNSYGGANNNSYSAAAANNNYPVAANNNNYPAATNNYPPANNYGGANSYNANYGY